MKRVNERKLVESAHVHPCFGLPSLAKVPCPLKPVVLSFNRGTHIYAACRRGTNIRKNGETDPFEELMRFLRYPTWECNGCTGLHCLRAADAFATEDAGNQLSPLVSGDRLPMKVFEKSV
ncbi:hypothetical protein V6N13_084671 [Hibiscus sabdariffa]|uniref:Uncharacterized protein n=1 Tax=Hibiscus sabdariffa TaxID=183260 RepID=A0ABR2T2H6_9ROSI